MNLPNLFYESIKIANAIDDEYRKAEVLTKIIVEKLEVKDNLSKILLAITIHLLNIIYMKCH